MKRIILLMTIFVLLFRLTGCGKYDNLEVLYYEHNNT